MFARGFWTSVSGKEKRDKTPAGKAARDRNDAYPENMTDILAGHGTGEGNLCIRLRNTGAADQAWDVILTGEVLIGRDTNCQVCLADNSVSRRQCRIYVDGAVIVENISQSNVTQLNEKRLVYPSIIKAGDKLKCGRVTLIVDSLYESESHNVGILSKGTEFINI